MTKSLAGRVRRVTGTAVIAGTLLVVLGMAGLSASVFVGAGLVVLGLLTAAFRDRFEDLLEHRVIDDYLSGMGFAPLLSGVVALLYVGASPGELQTLGAVIGLLGLLNHMVRPVYGFAYRMSGRLTDSSA